MTWHPNGSCILSVRKRSLTASTQPRRANQLVSSSIERTRVSWISRHYVNEMSFVSNDYNEYQQGNCAETFVYLSKSNNISISLYNSQRNPLHYFNSTIFHLRTPFLSSQKQQRKRRSKQEKAEPKRDRKVTQYMGEKVRKTDQRKYTYRKQENV